MNSETDKIFTRERPEKCPECDKSPVAQIAYGLIQSITADLRKELDAGLTVLGGCVIVPDAPSWVCTGCKTKFYHPEGVFPGLELLADSGTGTTSDTATE